ncbi:MAG: class I SAM-dependent RNA methyltransferase [Parachlamydia sp.]|nr:class I SAM-dependent RNA methyltransferase [Parachlamydia sp.]
MTLISGEIESIAFGGKGILRHEGKVVFIPYTAPQDRVTCRITHQHKNYSEAEIVTLDSPSPQRVEPLCPYFGKCGGCQLQHMTYEAQLEYKRQSVSDALSRIGKLNVQVEPVVPAEMRWAYRRHIALTVKASNGRFNVGYIADDHVSFLPVSQCPIFLDPSHSLLQQIQELTNSLEASPSNSGKLMIFKQGDRFFLQWHFKELPANAVAIMEKALTVHSQWAGCCIATPRSLHQLGNSNLELMIDGLSIQFSSRAFLQNHPEQSLNIYRMVQAQAETTKACKALDFYCGIGILSLLLARQGIAVKGVEQNGEAIKTARENSARNRITGAEFVKGDVKNTAEHQLSSMQPDFVIVNPPREGMDSKVIEALLASQVRTIVYISCMPSTLARDLKLLCQKYRFERCRPFDMFPQTGHVETVAILQS